MRERFKPTARSEQRYYSDVLGFARKYFEQAPGFVAQLLSMPEWLEAYAYAIAQAMVTHQLAENSRSWREAARIAGRGPEIYAALREELRGPVGSRYRQLVRRNAGLIKSLPLEVAEKVTEHAAKAQQEGRRFESVERYRLLSHFSRSKARLIARTEVAKAQANLTQARSEDLGLDWYVWETSQDQRVRRSHRKLQGVLVRFDDPPSPEALVGERSTLGHYGAGNAPNCRCYSAPLLNLSDVQWPSRVYVNGTIQRVTLTRFRQMNGLRQGMAA